MIDQNIRAEQLNGYFNHEVPDEMLPDWIKDQKDSHDHSKLATPLQQGEETKT